MWVAPWQVAPVFVVAPVQAAAALVSAVAAAVRVEMEQFSPDQDPGASVDAPAVAAAEPPSVVVAEAAASVLRHVHPELVVALVSLHVQLAAPAVDAAAARHVAVVA